MSYKKTALLVFAIFMGQQSAGAMTLEEYLKLVQSQNRGLRSFGASKEAASQRYEQGNLELSPVLFGGVNYLDDKARTFSTAGTLTRNETNQYNLGISKKFSSGTQLSLQGVVQSSSLEATTPATGPLALDINTSALSVSLSQSLWKNFFGRSTRLRWERESSQKQMEMVSYDLQAQQTLIRAEAAFWDLMYLQQELQIRVDSLERARRIEGWVRRRASNGIGDRADVLNAQGLVAARELQLLTAQDDLKAAEKNFADQIEWGSDQPLPKLQGELESDRALDSFVSGGKGEVVRLDTYMAALEARARQTSSEEAVENLRPDVILQGQYKTNGYGDSASSALSEISDTSYPTASVGISFNWLLDGDNKQAVKGAARADALAAKLKAERQLLESRTAWNEINRRHRELSAKIKAAQSLSEVQTSKAAAERDKLSKGRSITSNVITAEQDAAEAQLTLTKLKAEQRKLESQGRIFVKVEELL